VAKRSQIFKAHKVELTLSRRVAVKFQSVTLFKKMASTSKTYSQMQKDSVEIRRETANLDSRRNICWLEAVVYPRQELCK
jgi:hypothetical protein